MRDPNQQILFAAANPLEERLGKAFFDALPTVPGVYRMYSREGNLLYVGKAKDLRKRLFTYRRVKKGKASRKTVNLVRMIHAIEFEELPSEEEALLRENELLRTAKPPFNRAKTAPETYYYIHLSSREAALTINLGMSPVPADYRFGAFKGHLTVRRAVGATLRQLLVMVHRLTTAFEFPHVLIRKLAPYQFTIDAYNPEDHPELTAAVVDLFAGESDRLLTCILEAAEKRELLESFLGKMVL